jgi:peptide/nickel transport system permease protein
MTSIDEQGPTPATPGAPEAETVRVTGRPDYLRFLLRDPLALVAAVWLILMVLAAIFGPMLFGEAALAMDLRSRNLPALTLENGWINVLGTDALGRSVLARCIVGAQVTLAIAGAAALASVVFGTAIGLYAGFVGGWQGRVIMQVSDVIQSFPTILLAMVVLYMLDPRPANLIIVLAFGQLPTYIRVARAEVLELRERLYVDAARVLGASRYRILGSHIAPMVVPTVVNIVTIDFALIMLSESSLSFLGIGVQAPSITWGLLVSQGKDYLGTAWWISFFPGLMIMLATLSVNIVANWYRRVRDPRQRWRYERVAKGKA